MKFRIVVSMVTLTTALCASAQNGQPAAPVQGVRQVPQPLSPARPAAPAAQAPSSAPAPGQLTVVIDPRTGQQVIVTNGLMPQGIATNFFTTTNQLLLSTNGMVPRTNGFDRDDRFGTNGFDRDDRFGTNDFDRDDWRFRHTNDFDRDDWRFHHTNGFHGFSNRFGIFTNSTGTNVLDVMNSPGTNGFRGDMARTPQDAALLILVRQHLAPERHDGRMIQLSAQNGVITISGAVPSAEEGQEFVSLIQQTPGVVSVNNNLRIVPGLFSLRGDLGQDSGSTPADQRLAGQVRRHMGRRGRDQAGASESVHIVARNGVVTLVGFVSSIEERQALEAAVQSTPGVVQVIDQLQVRANAGIDTGAVGGSAGFAEGTNSSSAAGRPVNTSPFRRPGNFGTTTNITIGTNAVPTAPR